MKSGALEDFLYKFTEELLKITRKNIQEISYAIQNNNNDISKKIIPNANIKHPIKVTCENF